MGAFAEAQIDVVNGAVDETNNPAAAQNSLDAKVTVSAYHLNDMTAVVLAFPHCGADDHKQDCSLDGQPEFQRVKDSLEQHDPVA